MVMDRFDFIIDDALALRFRKTVFQNGSHKRGALRDAFIEAITDWIKNNSHSSLTQKPRNRDRRRFKR